MEYNIFYINILEVFFTREFLAMKTIILHGSPRENQNSDTLVDSFIRGLNTIDISEI